MSNAELIEQADDLRGDDSGVFDMMHKLKDALEVAEQNLAAAQAVIARAGAANAAPHANTKQSNSRMTAVDSALAGSPADALQAVKEAAWDECLDAIEQHELNTEQAREGNPYRRDKADE